MSAIPVSEGYLLVDSTKCTGCRNCMLVCSLAHEGETGLSLSRIHVVQEQLAPFPDDIRLHPCRQCVDPLCLHACPTGALHVDTENGNVRVIDEDACVGCGQCYDACAYEPKRIMWNRESGIAVKCDLCANTPYWPGKGGPGGKQACIEVCPVNAIAFTSGTPIQEGITAYEVDLRTETINQSPITINGETGRSA